MRWIDLELERNEASDLLELEDTAVLAAHGWDRAYYVVLDEGRLEDSIAVLGHREDSPLSDGWDHIGLDADVGDEAGRTDDTEAAARFDGHVYLVGSHFGSKGGPLKARRQWLARFPEAGLAGDLDGAELAVDVWRDRFVVHRAVNDALKASGLDVIDCDPRLGEAFVAAARDRGKKWADQLEPDDWPLNVEAAAFRPSGTLLLGLRYPISAQGAPLLVELAGVPERFEGGPDPVAVGAWRLDGPGAPDEPVGFRAMVADGDDGYDCILGSLDATDKGSLLLECHPGGGTAVSAHWRFVLDGATGGGVVAAERAAEFEDLQKIEGLAHGPDGHFVYVVDEDHRIHMRFLAVD